MTLMILFRNIFQLDHILFACVRLASCYNRYYTYCKEFSAIATTTTPTKRFTFGFQWKREHTARCLRAMHLLRNKTIEKCNENKNSNSLELTMLISWREPLHAYGLLWKRRTDTEQSRAKKKAERESGSKGKHPNWNGFRKEIEIFHKYLWDFSARNNP